MLVFSDHSHIVELPHGAKQKNTATLDNTTPSASSSVTEKCPLPWCFRCRRFSHIMKDCHIPKPEDDRSADIIKSTPPPDSFLFAFQQELDRHRHPLSICQRCQDLDIEQLFRMPLQPDNPGGHIYQVPSIYPHGIDFVAGRERADTAIFLSNCPLCRLLLIVSSLRSTPGTWKELQIFRVVTPFITNIQVPNNIPDINSVFDRLRSALDIPKSLFLTKSGTIPPHSLWVRMGICLRQRELGGLSMTPTCRIVGSKPDFPLLKSWIHDCQEFHASCQPPLDQTFLQRIRVVDVLDRINVPYNIDSKREYIALSYVWGAVKQKSYALYAELPRLPQTIEDAMVAVHELGKRYLWIDSLCIDQTDENHKASQIGIMDRIYRNAWATIVDLSGKSADSGLPRISSGERIRQFRCEIGDDVYISALPSLLAFAKQSPWSTRAWVLQEAVLSRRCLFFTKTQVYYECNSSKCSEAADEQLHYEEPGEKASPRHLTEGIFRIDFSPIMASEAINAPNERIKLYKELLLDYKKRRLTYFADSLNAFQAIIHTLSDGFGTEFIYGLPVTDLPYALGWRQKVPGQRVKQFPSWSWAAWEGELSRAAVDPYAYCAEQLQEDSRPFFEPYFRVEQFRDGRFVELLKRNVNVNHRPPWQNVAGDVDLLKAANMPSEDSSSGVGPEKAESRLLGPELLLVEGITLQLVVKVPGPEEMRYPTCDVHLGDEKCELFLASHEHIEVLRPKCRGEPQEFLMLHRAEWLDEIRYDLLMLEWKDGVAYRVDAVSLKVPGEKLPLIREAKPTKRRFWLG